MQQHHPNISPGYDEDFFAWTRHQAELLRAVRSRAADLPAGIDLDHLAEEIEDLGKAEIRGVRSLIRQLFVHLIKAASDRSPKAQAHWRTEATAFQADLPGYYVPSMRQLIDLDGIWRRALKLAETSLVEQSAALADLPPACPYAIDELVDEDFEFDSLLSKLPEAKR